jgi:hypothetical protein
MTSRTVALLAILASGNPAQAAERSTSAVALNIEAFKDGFRNCSRPTPQGITAFWQVGKSELDKTDAALLGHLERTGLAKKLHGPPSSYARQYIGYSRGKRRYIYVNASLRLATDGKSTYTRGCDGGNLFWGIEYDLQSQSFGQLEVNGVMGDPLEGLKL